MAVKRGDAAREVVRDKIVEAFGGDFLGIVDKKIYVQARDGANGELLQFAITMTMPKAQIDPGAFGGGNEPAEAKAPTPAPATKVELSAADKAKVSELMAKLGVTPSN